MRFLATLALAATALAGCTSGTADELDVELSWQDRSHAMMTVRNRGDRPIDMAQAMAGLQMMGPNGTVPMMWGGANGTMPMCRMGGGMMEGTMAGCPQGMPGMGAMHMSGSTLGPGGSWSYTMHAGMWNGTWGMMVVPGSGMPAHAGTHMPMMAGAYTVSMRERQATATLPP